MTKDYDQKVYNRFVVRKAQLRSLFTLGHVIMATSYCLPFAIFQFREFARQSYLAFELAAMVIVIGFLVCYWEDSQAKRAFSKERLTVAVMSLILFLILAPIFSSSAKFEAMVR